MTADSRTPVAWQYRCRSILPGGGWWGWRECPEADTIAYASDADKETRALYTEPIPNSAAETNTNSVLINDKLVVEVGALLKALEKIIAEVSERRVGHREKIAEIARTAIDQARGEK